mgnify:CR=1 FL=1
MRVSRVTLAAALAAGWIAAPMSIRAEDGDDDEMRSEQGEHEGHGPRGGRMGEGGGDKDGKMGKHRGMHKGGMGGMMGKRDHDMALHEKYMKMHEIEKSVRQAAQKARKGSDAEKAAAKPELKKLLGDLLDVKLDIDQYRLTKAEKETVELKEKIAKKKANRDKMIESRLSKMSGEGDDWED